MIYSAFLIMWLFCLRWCELWIHRVLLLR